MRHTKFADIHAQVEILRHRFTLLSRKLKDQDQDRAGEYASRAILNELRAIKVKIMKLNAKLSKTSYDRDCC